MLLEKSASVTYLPYIRTTFNLISRLMSRHNTKSLDLPPKKILSLLQPVKNDFGIKTPGVYSVSCTCSQVYIRQTGCSIETRNQGAPASNPSGIRRQIQCG
jgi:hypothetical protein